MTGPLRGHHVPLSPLEWLAQDFVIGVTGCPACTAPMGTGREGLMCTLRRSAALEQYLTNEDPGRLW
jgi:hypothetical protein